jgi:hypothetical protein
MQFSCNNETSPQPFFYLLVATRLSLLKPSSICVTLANLSVSMPSPVGEKPLTEPPVHRATRHHESSWAESLRIGAYRNESASKWALLFLLARLATFSTPLAPLRHRMVRTSRRVAGRSGWLTASGPSQVRGVGLRVGQALPLPLAGGRLAVPCALRLDIPSRQTYLLTIERNRVSHATDCRNRGMGKTDPQIRFSTR